MKTIPINVFDDNVPEINEEFCVQLFTPTGGAELGSVNESKCYLSNLFIIMNSLLSACVTILANDDPHGVFRFDMSSLKVEINEAGDTVTNDNSKLR